LVGDGARVEVALVVGLLEHGRLVQAVVLLAWQGRLVVVEGERKMWVDHNIQGINMCARAFLGIILAWKVF
jgi:hypothetical protein